MAGSLVKIYMSEEDKALWDYGISLLGRDRCRRVLFKFIRGQFTEILKKEAALPERQTEAREAAREFEAKRAAAKQRRKQAKEKAHETT